MNANISLALGIHHIDKMENKKSEIIDAGAALHVGCCCYYSFAMFAGNLCALYCLSVQASVCYCGNAKYAHNQSLNRAVKKGM